MNRQGTTAVLFLLAFGLGCVERLPAATSAPPRITAGFNGYVKSDQWFPVGIESAPGYTLSFLDVMQQGYGRDPATVLLRFGAEQDHETGGWRALAWLPRHHRGEAFLRCRFRSDDGHARPVDVPLRILAAQDLLVLAVSDRPDDFQFLRNIEHGRQRITRSVAGGAEILRGWRWQDLQAVDLVVLDGPSPLHNEDRRVLRHWLIMGGTVIVTDRALRHHEAWGFLPAAPPDLATRQTAATGDEAASLLNDLAPDVVSIPFVDAIPDSFVPLVTSRSGTLVGGQDLGRGRILVSAIEWTAMESRDRAMSPSVRQTLWAGLLNLRRHDDVSGLPHRIAIPKEARIRFLLGPLLGFLLGCLILLGPVNWLVLRWRRRREYMMVTLPAGAVVLAVGALIAGHRWRPRETLIHEISVTRNNSDASWTSGISGILSPGYREYAVATPDPEILFCKTPNHGNVFYPADREAPPFVTTLGNEGMRIDGVHIERWAMRFFSTSRPYHDGNGLYGEGRLTATNRIGGSIHNRTPYPVRDVWVVSDADRVFLGDIAPDTMHFFDLVLSDPRDHPERKCRGCGGYHLGVDPFDDREDEPPIPSVMKTLGHRQLFPRHHRLHMIGLTDAPPPSLHVMEPDRPIRRQTENIIVAPITMQWAERSPVPDRFIHRWSVPDAHDVDAWASRLQQLPLHYLPHGLAVKAALQISATTTGPDLETTHARHASGRPLRPIFFALPTLHDSSVIRIEWDRRVPATVQPADDTVILEAFDWEHDQWIPLGSVNHGLRHVRMTGADRTILPSTPGLSLRERAKEPRVTAPATHDRLRQGTLTVEVLNGDTVNDR